MKAETSYIGIVNKDESVDSIFLAREGKLHQVGYKLLNYTTDNDANRLIGQGDLVKLGYDLQHCLSFASHEKCPVYIRHDNNLYDFFDAARTNEIPNLYLFKDGVWKYTALQKDETYPQLLVLSEIAYYMEK